MKIEVSDNNLIRQRSYSTLYTRRRKMYEIMKDLLEAGIIVESISEYSSLAILTEKKDDDNHMCIDYRRVTTKIKKIQYPVPIKEEALDTLAGNKYLNKLDLASGYYQIEIEPDCHIRAFVTHNLYEYIIHAVLKFEFKYICFITIPMRRMSK